LNHDPARHQRGLGGHGDAEIAAIALANGMALGTRNLADFEGCGLELVNPFIYSTD
jgi:predicted nucleic acid-binding protein